MTAPAGTVVLAFDPTFRLGVLAVRWETIGLAASLATALLVAAWFAAQSGRRTRLSHLRPDDLLYLALASAPGAILGGRAMQALDYADYYRAHPAALLDPAQGSLSLLGAVIGGTITAAWMARLLRLPVGRWLDVASVPLLLAIALGKVAQLLGGGGQGLPFDGSWAVAFAGPGPWLAPSPGIPAHPSQLYEAGWCLLGVIVVVALRAGPVLRSLPSALRQEGAWAVKRRLRGMDVAVGRLKFGYSFLSALAWWIVGRFAVAFTWEDSPVFGSLSAEQVADGAMLAVLLLVLAVSLRSRPSRGDGISLSLRPPADGERRPNAGR